MDRRLATEQEASTETEKTITLPQALFQQLVDEAYTLAGIVHTEDVPEMGVEHHLIAVIRRIREDLHIEPTHYHKFGDYYHIVDSSLTTPDWKI